MPLRRIEGTWKMSLSTPKHRRVPVQLQWQTVRTVSWARTRPPLRPVLTALGENRLPKVQIDLFTAPWLKGWFVLLCWSYPEPFARSLGLAFIPAPLCLWQRMVNMKRLSSLEEVRLRHFVMLTNQFDFICFMFIPQDARKAWWRSQTMTINNP